ncbi:MAG: mechanosensitive ion channel protein MscS [Puniceicoccaceae bacterium 5H]|nr:MAG: mechanosensitive ion channel protein MscS [Puniceicoccaceae bacterium 5H]
MFDTLAQVDYYSIGRAVAMIVIGLPLLYLLSRGLGQMLVKHGSEHSSVIVRRFVLWGGMILIVLFVLTELGYDITGLVATAGIATVAIGFAAQTTLSNFISGLFLIGEKPFRIGDLIRIGDRLGIVSSIDMLSVKLRTFDNLFVRIPNEEMIKREVVNITRFPIRRMDIDVRVAYSSNLSQVENILKELALNNPYALDDPEPLILVKDFRESEIVFLWGVWFEKNDYLNLRNALLREMKERFEREGIEIPYPHLKVYAPKGGWPDSRGANVPSSSDQG